MAASIAKSIIMIAFFFTIPTSMMMVRSRSTSALTRSATARGRAR